METILSTKNERVKNWKKLQTKKGREQAGAYLIEGIHLIDEAIKNQASISELIISEDKQLNLDIDYPVEKQILVSAEISKQLSETETSQCFCGASNAST